MSRENFLEEIKNLTLFEKFFSESTNNYRTSIGEERQIIYQNVTNKIEEYRHKVKEIKEIFLSEKIFETSKDIPAEAQKNILSFYQRKLAEVHQRVLNNVDKFHQTVEDTKNGLRKIILNDNTLETDHQEQLQLMLSYIEARHKGILDLETSVKELHHLFEDFAILVDQQGECIDKIENNVSKAATHVKKANEELIVAGKIQKKSRKNLCCLSIILTTAVGLIIGIPTIILT